jgi:hypothetical protein
VWPNEPAAVPAFPWGIAKFSRRTLVQLIPEETKEAHKVVFANA